MSSFIISCLSCIWPGHNIPSSYIIHILDSLDIPSFLVNIMKVLSNCPTPNISQSRLLHTITFIQPLWQGFKSILCFGWSKSVYAWPPKHTKQILIFFKHNNLRKIKHLSVCTPKAAHSPPHLNLDMILKNTVLYCILFHNIGFIPLCFDERKYHPSDYKYC